MSKFKQGMPITVSFTKSIRTDGELARVRIVQGDQEIQLTTEQVKSLITRLESREEFRP